MIAVSVAHLVGRSKGHGVCSSMLVVFRGFAGCTPDHRGRVAKTLWGFARLRRMCVV
ncbi:hypothetical protein ALQ59_101361 [Pseudomonas syringae pv. apii]|uniref:Uncharacterized protein n=1 Tax=Pseudomonas syringae pv. apii TaxID=81036 RepID=A0A3M3MMD8_9PSED|nr:hypothetical protein ALQ58_101181 [Pseudomonas syringae pv. apii]RMN51048.1 hypothetical protein ALQ59_101361 [Pseudomonas syringae pv. apii]RMO01459.1 hypothetical protein ALQ49_100989 [Pseudomonas syringae pv. apii]